MELFVADRVKIQEAKKREDGKKTMYFYSLNPYIAYL